jgi:hypothetical protein
MLEDRNFRTIDIEEMMTTMTITTIIIIAREIIRMILTQRNPTTTIITSKNPMTTTDPLLGSPTINSSLNNPKSRQIHHSILANIISNNRTNGLLRVLSSNRRFKHQVNSHLTLANKIPVNYPFLGTPTTQIRINEYSRK